MSPEHSTVTCTYCKVKFQIPNSRKRKCNFCAPDHYRRYMREWRARDPDRGARSRASSREYRARNKDARAKTVEGWNERNKEKRQAHGVVWTAIRKGVLAPARGLLCIDCGNPAASYDHYLGYAPEHRLDVQPVCSPCHGQRTWKGADADVQAQSARDAHGIRN
jgi:hypothetical protein